jgi:hypothetical protein
MTSEHLTKSRYTAGLQCLRRLWLIDHEPASHEEPAPGSPLDIGQEIGRKAHLLFPGGALVDEPPWRHVAAVARTAALNSVTSRGAAMMQGLVQRIVKRS